MTNKLLAAAMLAALSQMAVVAWGAPAAVNLNAGAVIDRLPFGPEPYPYSRPYPHPHPVPGQLCPDGTPPVFNEFTGLHDCEGDWRSRPLPWRDPRIEEPGIVPLSQKSASGISDSVVSARRSLGSGDAASAASGLSRAFDGSGVFHGMTSISAVVAPAGGIGASLMQLARPTIRLAHTDPSVPVPTEGKKNGQPRFLLVDCGDLKGDCRNDWANKGESIIRDGVDLWNAPQRWENQQRDNERRYQQGTDDWNKTHEDYLRRHNQNVS